MTSFYIETYDKYYDYDYEVIAETEDIAKEKLKKYWLDIEEEEKTILRVHGPNKLGDVICVKSPNV